jgi:hypothetical protein
MIHYRKKDVPSQRTPAKHFLETTSTLRLRKAIVLFAMAFNSDLKFPQKKPPGTRVTLPRIAASSSCPTKAISPTASNSFSKVSSPSLHEIRLLRWGLSVNNSLNIGWANNIKFPFRKDGVPEPGFDAIIGQITTDLPPRVLSGTDPKNQAPFLTLNEQWVVTRGGEYFFSPSISALRETFALKNTDKTELR